MAAKVTDTPNALGRNWVLLILAVAALIRLVGLWSVWAEEPQGDPKFYVSQAQTIADGKGYTDPFADLRHSNSIESADHPPLFVSYLAIWNKLGADSVGWQRIATSLLGLISVALVSILSFRLGGVRAAQIGGICAAAWPNLWYWDIAIQSESLAAVTVLVFCLSALSYIRRPSLDRLVIVGAAVGLAGLARAELVLLFAAVIPIAILTVSGLRKRVAWSFGALLGMSVVIAPWTLYNQSRFEHPVALSNGLGLVLVSSNCDAAYYGERLGYWAFGCSVAGTSAAGILPSDDQSVADQRRRDVAVEYALDHKGRMPAVATARGLRYVGIWSPKSSAEIARVREGMPDLTYLTIQALFLGALGFAIYGARQLRARRADLIAVWAAPTAGLIVAILIYGIVRFRAPVEPPILAIASVGLARFGEQRRARQLASEPAEATTD